VQCARQEGYSLIEILAAVAILAIAVLPLMGMFTAALRSAHFAQITSQAAFHGQALVEDVVAASGSTLSALKASFERTLPVNIPNTQFAFTRHIDSHGTGLIRVTVVIYWTDGQGARQYRVVTLIE